jgi:predicted transcriptional regulator
MKMTVRADGFEGWAKRGRERALRLAKGEKIVAEKVINFESPFDFLDAISPQKVRLCLLARTKPHSVTGLATALKRDPKSVRRDVTKLVKYGMLRTREEINPGHGRVKIVEPAANGFDLRAKF